MNEKTDQAILYLRQIFDGFCQHPDELVFTPALDELGLNIRIEANPVDLPLLIGRKGSVISSVRRLLDLWGRKHHARVNVVVPPKP